MAAVHITERIKALREQAGFSMAETAEAMGFAKPSSYQHYEDPGKFRKKYVPLHIAERMAGAWAGKAARGRKPVTREEILALAGPYLTASPQDTELLAVFDRITPEKREGVLRMLNIIASWEGGDTGADDDFDVREVRVGRRGRP